MRVVYLPIETLTREIDSMVYLSKYLLESGNVDTVILGNKHLLSILMRLNLLPKGVWHIKSAQSFTKPFLQKLKQKGFFITLQNAEALATFDSEKKIDLYEIPLDTVDFVDLIFCANKHEFTKIKEFHNHDVIEKLCTTGFIRSALSVKECREFYSSEILEITKKYPVYILYNSSAGLKYHSDIVDMYALLLAQGASEDHALELMSWSDQLQATLFAFLEFVRITSNFYSEDELKIVYRPHPSEDAEFVKKLFSGHSMVIVNSDYSVLPWILGSAISIASTSTTLIESASLNIPTVSFVPEINADIMELLYRNSSNLCGMLAKNPEQLLQIVQGHISNADFIRFGHKNACELIGKELNTMKIVTEQMSSLLNKIKKNRSSGKWFYLFLPSFVFLANFVFKTYSKFSKNSKEYAYADKKFKTIDSFLFNKIHAISSSLKTSDPVTVKLYEERIITFKLDKRN